MGNVRLCVLVSGSGTILEAMIDSGLDIALVASDRVCRGLEIAREADIESLLVDRTQFGGFAATFDRPGYSQALADLVTARDIDLIAMAGFGTITTAEFQHAFPGRVLNTHPSLLPMFKGWHAVRQAIEAGVTETGCTVHVVTVELDAGPVLARGRVTVLAGDDEASLHERIKAVERTLYPHVVKDVVTAIGQGREPSDLVIL